VLNVSRGNKISLAPEPKEGKRGWGVSFNEREGGGGADQLLDRKETSE